MDDATPTSTSKLHIPLTLHKRRFPRPLILLLRKLKEEISMLITINVTKDRITRLRALICVVETATAPRISMHIHSAPLSLSCAKRYVEKKKRKIVSLARTYLYGNSPKHLGRILHQVSRSALAHAQAHQRREDKVVLLVTDEDESFRDMVGKCGEALDGLCARGV
jgi:hypothetical protein